MQASNNTITNAEKLLEEKSRRIKELETANEKLVRKIEYLENFIYNATQFEKTRSALDFNNFVDTNIKTFDNLVDEIYSLKENKLIDYLKSVEEPPKDTNSLATPSPTTDQGKASPSPNPRSSQKKPVDPQEVIAELRKEIESLTSKNKRYLNSLNKKEFFKEYEMLLREVDGLRKQNDKLGEKLQLRASPG